MSGSRRSGMLVGVKLSAEEMELFDASCRDLRNIHAQELLNVFAVEDAHEVLAQLHHAPLGLFADLVVHLWNAVRHETNRRGTEQRGAEQRGAEQSFTHQAAVAC